MAHVTYNEVRTSLFTPALGGLSCEAEEILNNGQLVMISYGVNVLPIITPTRLFWLNEKCEYEQCEHSRADGGRIIARLASMV